MVATVGSAESFGFEADIQQLLHLIITAFYSDKSVFLRELLSNSSDALDKIRLEGLTDPSVLSSGSDLRIRITPDKEARTLTIEDTGIGMTREELVKNLGTLARSGTRAFMEAMQKGADSRLIGQFGVGFYSSFLIADHVVVTSKHNADGEHVWESGGQGSFTVAESLAPTLQRGSRIVLHVKEDMTEYLEDSRLRQLVQRHCAFISYPIELLATKTIEVDAPQAAEGVIAEEVVDKSKLKPAAETPAAGAPEAKAPGVEAKKEKKEVREFERVNGQPPIWTRAPSEILEDEYKVFYKAISNDWDDYAVKRHFVGEGTVEFQALLYVPKHPPMDMLMGVASQDRKQRNIKLYARKVLIMDEFDEFLPPYLCFVKGVVNSDDIPLNVSRELLQDNKMLKFIAKNLVKRCLDMFNELAADPVAYKSFFNAFSTNLKLGIHEDTTNREKLMDLLRFPSSKTLEADAAEKATKPEEENDKDPMAALMGAPQGHQGSLASFKDYVARMPEGQEEIYVITGESVRAVESSPFMERFRQRGLEVLYLTEPIDEYVLTAMQGTPYQGKRLANITMAGVKVPGVEGEDEKEAADALQKDHEALCELVKKVVTEGLEKVEVSRQLVDSPCALVAPQYGQSANMERIMRAQALQSQEQRLMMNPMLARRTLLLNPAHELVKWLHKEAQAGPDKAAEDSKVRDTIRLLFDTALMSSGFPLEEPSAVASRIHTLMVSKL